MILHRIAILENFLTHGARRLQSRVRRRMHVTHVNFQFPRRRESFHALFALVFLDLEVRSHLVSLQRVVGLESSFTVVDVTGEGACV